jgi:hypothetical protein
VDSACGLAVDTHQPSDLTNQICPSPPSRGNAAEMAESEAAVKAALSPDLRELGDDVVDYLAGAVADELANHPPRAPRAPLLAALADILAPFLQVHTLR